MREPLRILILLFWMSVSAKNEKELDFGEVLVDGQKVHLYLIKGTLEPANWSYFELKWTGPFRLILDSLAGDADVYVSTRKKHPGVRIDEHEMLSTTCGLDVLDVPQSLKRPVYVGIYGHPSKQLTSYNLLIAMLQKIDSEFEDPIDISPDIIYSIDNFQDDGEVSSLKDYIFAFTRLLFEVILELML